MQYLRKSFTVHGGQSEAYRNNWQEIFRPVKEKPKRVKWTPVSAAEAASGKRDPNYIYEYRLKKGAKPVPAKKKKAKPKPKSR